MSFPEATMIELGDVTLEVFTATPEGVANPPAALLCHGWPEHAYSWRAQVPMLLELGYQVIVPNQRGYGASTQPEAVTAYDADALTGDLVGLLDHYGHDQAVFIGHDWGAINVWNAGLLHPDRVSHIINLSVPYFPRGETEWVSFWEKMLGPDFYIVHFNRQPGVADAAFAANAESFLRNLYRTRQWEHPPVDLGPGMAMINIAQRDSMPGDPLMSDAELEVFLRAFQQAGFTGGINWYRNFTRNWSRLAGIPERFEQPTLMIYGQYDMVPPSETLGSYVTDLEVVTLPCGHWIQQEEPEATNAAIASWLQQRS